MEKEKIHYVVYTNNGELLIIDSLEKFFRQDIKLMIKRTFVKKTGGQSLYSYFKNQVLNKKLENVKNNTFKWNKLICTIDENEFWGTYQDNPNVTSIILTIKVKDYLKREYVLRYPTLYKDHFKNIQNDLELLDRVGTLEGFFEIRKLEKKIENLENKLAKAKSKKA